MIKTLWSKIVLISAAALTPIAGHAQDLDFDTNIVGSWVCQSNATPAGTFGILATFNAGGTFQSGTDNDVFGEAHGVYRRSGLHSFQSFDKAFVFNAQGLVDQIRVARSIETLLSPTTMKINVNITITDRAGTAETSFPAVLSCDRMEIDFAPN